MKRLLYQFPGFFQRIYPDAIWRGDTQSRCVYLTFDDGPIPQVTPQVLDILDRFNVKATFFWVGENVMRYPDIAREVVMRGHRAGNHTYNHLNGWKTPTDIYTANITKADTVMRETLGNLWQMPPLFRPPYGKAGLKARSFIREQGYKVVLWDIITHDYNPHYKPEIIEKIILKYVRNGSIILMHDSLKAERNVLAVLPRILQRLRDEGYEFRLLSSN